MSRESAQAFWSYVHADDEAERGLIVGLARALRAEYELITGGGRLELYVDRDDIAWGSNRRGELDRAVRAAGFFVPIITPRYFLSTECRLELDYFQSRAKAAGALKLLLPIYYASVPELDHREKPADPAMRAIHDIHREDWRAIRFQDPSWPHYREAVNRMAARIAQVVKDLTAGSVTSAAPLVADATDDVVEQPAATDADTLPRRRRRRSASMGVGDQQAGRHRDDRRAAGVPCLQGHRSQQGSGRRHEWRSQGRRQTRARPAAGDGADSLAGPGDRVDRQADR